MLQRLQTRQSGPALHGRHLVLDPFFCVTLAVLGHVMVYESRDKLSVTVK